MAMATKVWLWLGMAMAMAMAMEDMLAQWRIQGGTLLIQNID